VQIPASDPSGKPANVGFLVGWLCDNLMVDKRKDMFVMDGTV
jgi:ubiquitin related modifier 1